MIKIGIFGIGLDTYWPQFEGLLDRLISYQSEISQQLKSYDVDLIDAGMVDNIDKANSAASLFNSEEVELIFLYVSTYALSSTVLPIAQKTGKPIVVLNLQPVSSIDYKAFNELNDRGKMTGEWLAHCQACTVPEIASVFKRTGVNYHLVTGYLDDPIAWTDIKNWVDAVKVKVIMRENRLGIIGNYYGGMLDVYSDLTQHSGVFGNHFEMIELSELKSIRDSVTKSEIQNKVNQFHQEFDVSTECEKDEIARAAKTSCALDILVKKRRLGSIAYYFEGPGDPGYENIATSIIAGNTLLTGNHVPVAEGEVKNAQAMKIMDSFGVGGSFSEFYLMDFDADIVFLGHDGPAHIDIADTKVGLVPLPLYHGKPGKGLSIQMTVKNGPVTLLSVVQEVDGKLSLLVAEGECVPGEVLQIGNTNSRYKFPIGARAFIDNWSKAGPAHHCAIGIGHITNKIQKLCALLGIEVNVIC